MITLHMGSDDRTLSLVEQALETTSIPIKIFHPTHVTRSRKLMEDAFAFARKGGYIDMTCGSKGESAPSLCVMRAKEQGVPMQNITFSSDGMGSWSTYDEGRQSFAHRLLGGRHRLSGDQAAGAGI